LACHERKTPKDLKEIAKAKRLAESHQEHQERQRYKVPGRRLPSRRQWQQMQGTMQSRGATPTTRLIGREILRLGPPKKTRS
jgi:hypothetical protein